MGNIQAIHTKGMHYVTKQGTNINQKLTNQHARHRSLIVKFMFTVAKDRESDASLETQAENDTPIHAKHR